MLILTRRTGSSVIALLDESDAPPRMTVHVIEIKGQMVRLGFEAPDSVAIYREELLQKIEDEPKG